MTEFMMKPPDVRASPPQTRNNMHNTLNVEVSNDAARFMMQTEIEGGRATANEVSGDFKRPATATMELKAPLSP